MARRTLNVIGLMSGTSMDGIDVALVRTDGERLESFGPARTYPFSASDRAAIAAGISAATGLRDRAERPPALAAAEAVVTERHGEAVRRFLDETGLASDRIDLVGFHGQTVLHAPERGLTVQIGDGQALADTLGVDVAWDFRAADVSAGGEGAPLAPAFHKAMAGHGGVPLPAAVLNIGGVANVTLIKRDGSLVAFDTGPGNALIDDWMMRHKNEACDRDGATAASGAPPGRGVIDRFLAHPFFARPAPKSLDRHAFPLSLADGLSVEDGARLLTELTVAGIARGAAMLPEPPLTWIVAGGGRHNGFLMRRLRKTLEAPVLTAEDAGFDGDAVEAQAFAYLAARSLNGLPLTFPGTTGAPQALRGGRIASAARAT